MRSFRPRLEWLEDRIQLGDTILGLWTVAGLSFSPGDRVLIRDAGGYDELRQVGLVSHWQALDLLADMALREEAGHPTSGEEHFHAAALEQMAPFDISSSLSDREPPGQLAMSWPPSTMHPVDLGLTGGAVGAPWQGSGEVFAATLLATNGESPASVRAPLAGAGSAPSALPPVQLSFDGSTGQLGIRADAGPHAISEGVTPDGFVNLTIDGQSHSSNPRSTAFDPALGGATGTTVAGIYIQGGGQDTLTIGTQQHAGSFTVQAVGATVLTQNVVATGALAIRAPDITISGTVQGSSIALAAPGWVTVEALGRIDAAQPGSGGRIEIAAGHFVNTGQLHGDGSSGGQINIRTANFLNAGPITADGTGPGGNGGQVHIAFTDAYIGTTAAVVSASSSSGPGGSLTMDGGSTGHLFSSGRQLATGLVGGAIDLLGRDIVLAAATVEVSGQQGGGSVRLGAVIPGSNPDMVAAQTVTVTPSSTIRADARQSGSGGRVSIDAKQTTTFNGVASARGGRAGGSGGFIEVSGPGDLSYGGSADAGAWLGKSGTLLLDPKNITIGDAPAGVFPQFDMIDPHPDGAGSVAKEIVVLANGNVLVTKPSDSFGGPSAGVVYLFDGLSGALISSLVGSHPRDNVGNGVSTEFAPVSGIMLLSNGNYVVVSSNWNSNRGAVTWGSSSSGMSGTVSDANSLIGSSSGDYVGAIFRGITPDDYVPGITPLSNGSYVVDSPLWNSKRGAVTWGSGTTGVIGTVSDTNSLVGANAGDDLGSGAYYLEVPGIIALSNGNYLVDSPFWNKNRGAVTWGNGTTGVSGTGSAANSLVGSIPGDYVGGFDPNYGLVGGITVLSNDNYVVESPFWNGDRGAATWGSGSRGVGGAVSDSNSLVGTNPGFYYGDHVGFDVYQLTHENYVVVSPLWNSYRGAVTWGNGNTGVSGTVSASNSLVGSNVNDGVGNYGVTPLTNGNYVVNSPDWNTSRGAVTWANGSIGFSGTISAANSLVGSKAGYDPFDPRHFGPPGDSVGVSGVTPLSNGNYVVDSPIWGSGGAVTWGNGETGVTGSVSQANSLIGANAGDLVGSVGDPQYLGSGVTALSNGNYLIESAHWNSSRGAATWGKGTTGVIGMIAATNSLVGGNPGDQVGESVEELLNGNFVVTSPSWNGGRGAATWGIGSTGIAGTVSDANSLVGSNPKDFVGGGYHPITPLSNGNFVVENPDWNGGRGAVTWGNGSTGISGTVTQANSLVGSDAGDQVGELAVKTLSNGNYVVSSPFWNNNSGAVTWGNGTSGVSGMVSDANSLVGGQPNDYLGAGQIINLASNNITTLANDNYVVDSPLWNGDRGAVTWGSGSTGVSGTVSDANSFVGGIRAVPLSNGNYVIGSSGRATWVNGTTGKTLDGLNVPTPENSLVGVGAVIEDPVEQTFLAPYGSRIKVGLADPNELSYGRGQAETVAITPQYLEGTLNTGTAVVLQASNDITVNSPIQVSAGGNGGALTLQAGRSVVLNASITTDNGPLTLIANDQLVNGVVDSQRDPGSAVITMAPGTTLNTGSGALTVQLNDGAGLTNSDSGPITLQSVTAGSISVSNNGPSAGSDITVGPVTTNGRQTYSDPEGFTTVNCNLTAQNEPITFTDSVVVSDGVRVDAGSSTVNFAGSGLQTLQSGSGSRFVNLNHTGVGTLQLTSGLTVTGSFTNTAGTFDANNQPVTVTGPAVLAGGTYLAGTAPQTFSGGLVLATGTFTSSSGAMNVVGPIALLGGVLSGEGTLGPLTALAGTIAPEGGNLSVAGAVSLFSSMTFRVLVTGPTPGSEYGQLQSSGLMTLGGGTLSLMLGFEPPVGSSFEIVTNTGSTPISGTFQGRGEGAVFSQDGYQFQITYQGGTANKSVVVTRVG
jgi:hypothetical protein